MTTTPVTLVFIPGAWHTPSCYESVVDHLTRAHPHGYDFITVSLPSLNCPRNSPSMDNWQPDVDVVHTSILSALTTTTPTNVVAISHSYGSLVTNEALGVIPVTYRSRLKHIILCGFLLPQGLSLRGNNPDAPYPALWAVRDDIVYTNDPAGHFYHDLSAQDQEKFAGQLEGRYMPLASFTTPVKHTAWKSIPTTYVLCEDDQAVQSARQEGMLVRCKQEGADIRVEKIRSGHSPFLKVPEQVAEIIDKVSSGAVE